MIPVIGWKNGTQIDSCLQLRNAALQLRYGIWELEPKARLNIDLFTERRQIHGLGLGNNREINLWQFPNAILKSIRDTDCFFFKFCHATT